ncbi:cobalt-precorrin-6A reductase [Marinibacterium sp. SX1]|uniref:cobalt-precorrin-6A reductase n=1 Tax=Marinibacterium sp. SX1 TaxID=3388424 RepID=UPI003D16A174
MRRTLLILGGTTEASALARAVAAAGIPAVLSLAGRVADPKAQPLPLRIGGFGGVDGLVAYLRDTGVTHLVDATHPFAAGMSANAVAAAQAAGVPLIALGRPPWTAGPGDNWQVVPDIAAAVARLAAPGGPARRIFLATGRQTMAAFAVAPRHHYVVRLVDPPQGPLPFPDGRAIIARGPFDEDADRALLQAHAIDLVVSKNAGGTGAHAKIAAARALGLPVLMIDRPALPPRPEAATVDAVLDWLAHASTFRGV